MKHNGLLVFGMICLGLSFFLFLQSFGQEALPASPIPARSSQSSSTTTTSNPPTSPVNRQRNTKAERIVISPPLNSSQKTQDTPSESSSSTPTARIGKHGLNTAQCADVVRQIMQGAAINSPPECNGQLHQAYQEQQAKMDELKQRTRNSKVQF